MAFYVCYVYNKCLDKGLIMKKLAIIMFLILATNICYAARWFEILDKKYIDISSIDVNPLEHVTFWIKALKKPGETITGIGSNFWYSLDKFTVDCRNKRVSTDVIMIYDLKEKLIYSDELRTHDWHSIAPDTYADAYYRYFCIVPFDENPLLQN